MKKRKYTVLCLTILCMLTVIGCSQNKETGIETQTETNSETEIPALKFPYMLEEEQLEIASLSTATMPNPDANGEMGENIASLEVVNTTGKYLAKAEIEVSLEDGTLFEFIINDLPKDGKVQAFDRNNKVFDDKVACTKIEVHELELQENEQLMSDVISFAVEETKVTLTNISHNELENLTVTCLCNMGESYFGGTSYSYKVDKIPAGGSVSIDAEDCYLGVAEVVRITKEN